MTDREVGELWHDLNKGCCQHDSLLEKTLYALINKLVDERARNKRLQRLMEDCGHYTYPSDQLPLDRSVNEEVLARRDFGIPDA